MLVRTKNNRTSINKHPKTSKYMFLQEPKMGGDCSKISFILFELVVKLEIID